MKKSAVFLLSLIVVVTSLAVVVPAQEEPHITASRTQVAHKNARNETSVDADRREPGRTVLTDEDLLRSETADPQLREIASLERQCFNEVNRMRRAHGLVALQFSDELLDVARHYSRRMAEEKFFAHGDPDGRTVRERIELANIRWRMVGENLAYSNGYINPVAASMRGWMDSPGHRRNLLEPGWRQTAIGAWISNDGTVYFTEIFLTQ